MSGLLLKPILAAVANNKTKITREIETYIWSRQIPLTEMTGDIAVVMAGIFGALLVVLFLLSLGLTVTKEGGGGNWLPLKANAAKRSFEIYALGYSVVWIGVFAVVVAQKHYEYFEEVRL